MHDGTSTNSDARPDGGSTTASKEPFVSPRLPRSFWFIWSSLLVNKAAGFVVIVLTLYLTSQRGLDVSEAGIVVGLFGAGGAVECCSEVSSPTATAEKSRW